MIFPYLSASYWVPVLAASGDTGDVLLKLLNLGAVGIGMFLLIRGDLRLKREVDAAETRADAERAQRVLDVEAADKRTQVAEARAEREAANRQRIQDEVLTVLAPAMLKVSTAGEELVEASNQNAQLLQEVIRAFLRRIETPG